MIPYLTSELNAMVARSPARGTEARREARAVSNFYHSSRAPHPTPATDCAHPRPTDTTRIPIAAGDVLQMMEVIMAKIEMAKRASMVG